MAVAAEECNELGIELIETLKRCGCGDWNTIITTRDKVIEERADVEIVLNHINSLYELDSFTDFNCCNLSSPYYTVDSILCDTVRACNKLSIAVLKFMRYENPSEGIKATRDKVKKCCTDLIKLLHYIDRVYDIQEIELTCVISGKIGRLERWLKTSNNMEYTMVDRAVR